MLMFYCATLQSIIRRRIPAWFGKSKSEKQACHRAQNSYEGNGENGIRASTEPGQAGSPSTKATTLNISSSLNTNFRCESRKDFVCKNRTTWSYRLHRLQSSCWTPEPCSMNTASLQHSLFASSFLGFLYINHCVVSVRSAVKCLFHVVRCYRIECFHSPGPGARSLKKMFYI